MNEAFDRLVASLAGREGVAIGERRGFGANALQANGRIFAMVSGGRVVLKLPEPRVAELLASGAGTPFDAGKGRPMKEWVAIPDVADDALLELAEEARRYAGSRS